jgi:membrane-associated phospholipid phosphatase
MAELLKIPRADWWPVDKVILGYFGATMLLESVCWPKLANPVALLVLHLAGAALIVLAAFYPGNRAARVFHCWYPLPYVALCYREMSAIIRAWGRPPVDLELAHLDLAFWGANPTVWLERFRSHALAEGLEIVYSLFVPAVLLTAFLLWRKKRFCEFRYYAFLIASGFLVSYVGYFFAPARGPRFLLHDLQTYDLRGLWLFDGLRGLLDRIESAHYDCFPSGHTEMTILAWWGSRTISAHLFRWMFAYTLGVIFATVYLRYHYTVDVLAGAFVAGALILMTPWGYRKLGGKRGGEA